MAIFSEDFRPKIGMRQLRSDVNNYLEFMYAIGYMRITRTGMVAVTESARI